ncbi:Dyp-type peroxidase [Luteimonas sp. A482]
MLELHDIQNGALQPRPLPYVGIYFLLRVDDARAGREMLRRLIPALDNATSPASPERQAWVSAALTFQGLKALGVPQASLDSFPVAFQQGMAARAAMLGDVGQNAPEHWEYPLGRPDVHIAVSALAPDEARLEAVLATAREVMKSIPGVEVIWRQPCHVPADKRNPFGFADGLSNPAIEGTPFVGNNPQEVPTKAGEFFLGYENEFGEQTPVPVPEALGRNGTFIAMAKYHTHVAVFRQYLRANAVDTEDEERVAAKMVGRWRSGAPLSLAPDRDDPELGNDPRRNNNFLYEADDARGLKCPMSSHARRMHPRDARIIGVSRVHRVMRRGTAYGPMLPPGVLEDDGVDRGIVFLFIGADLERQFEFVKKEWVNDGTFIGSKGEKDPMIGPNDGTGLFTIPQEPIRRRLKGMPAFVTIKGGEYFFAPGLRALRWLAELDT